jgi:hypothetical protein
MRLDFGVARFVVSALFAAVFTGALAGASAGVAGVGRRA